MLIPRLLTLVKFAIKFQISKISKNYKDKKKNKNRSKKWKNKKNHWN